MNEYDVAAMVEFAFTMPIERTGCEDGAGWLQRDCLITAVPAVMPHHGHRVSHEIHERFVANRVAVFGHLCSRAGL